MKLKCKIVIFYTLFSFSTDSFSLDKKITVNGVLINKQGKEREKEKYGTIPFGHNFYLLRDNSGKKLVIKIHKNEISTNISESE